MIKTFNKICFQDLGSGDLTKELYVVAHVYRIGRMLHSDSTKNKILSAGAVPTSVVGGGGGVLGGGGCGAVGHFKRPHAVAVLNIGDVSYFFIRKISEISFTFINVYFS